MSIRDTRSASRLGVIDQNALVDLGPGDADILGTLAEQANLMIDLPGPVYTVAYPLNQGEDGPRFILRPLAEDRIVWRFRAPTRQGWNQLTMYVRGDWGPSTLIFTLGGHTVTTTPPAGISTLTLTGFPVPREDIATIVIRVRRPLGSGQLVNTATFGGPNTFTQSSSYVVTATSLVSPVASWIQTPRVTGGVELRATSAGGDLLWSKPLASVEQGSGVAELNFETPLTSPEVAAGNTAGTTFDIITGAESTIHSLLVVGTP